MRKIGLTYLALASILAISSIFPSYAAVNGTGDGETTGTSTSEIVGSFHAYHVNQGTRMTIVNSEGIPVSNSVDFVNYFPEDITEGINISSENINYMWSKYKTNTGSDRNTLKKYIQYLGGCKTDLTYAISQTCLIDKSSASASELETDSKYNGLLTIRRTDNNYTKSGNKKNNYSFVPAKMYTYSLLEQLLNLDAQKFGYTNPIDGSAGTFTYATSAGEQRTVSKQFKPPMIEGITSAGVSGLLTTGEEMKQQLMAPVEYTNSKGEKVSSNIIQRIIEMDGLDMNGRGNKKSNNFVRVFEYIDPKLKSQYDELYAKNAGSPMSTVFRENNLRLLIEPVAWMVGGVSNPTDPDPNKRGAGMEMSFSTPYVIYGTVTNAYQYIAQKYDKYCNDKNLFSDKPSINDWGAWIDWTKLHGLGFAWEWGLHSRGYRIEADEPGLGLYKYDPDTQDTLQNFLRYYPTLGYGVMVTSLDEDTAIGTPTWDTTSYPPSSYEPGPAPKTTNDDGTYPKNYPSEGESYKTQNYPDGTPKDHNFNIIKFYGTRNSDNTITYTENHTRNQTLHTITLNDEPNYIVDDYFTSPKFKEPESQSTSYDDYKATLPIGSLTGTAAGTITIPSESNDTTLYMRLISTEEVPTSNPSKILIPLFEDEVVKQVSLNVITPDTSRQVEIELPALPSDKTPSRSYQEKYAPGGGGGWVATYHYTHPFKSIHPLPFINKQV